MKDTKKSNQTESNQKGSNWLLWIIITSSIVFGLSYLATRCPYIKLNLENPINANFIEYV